MVNKQLTFYELTELITKYARYTPIVDFNFNKLLYMGMPVITTKQGRFILFEACEYCGNNKLNDKNQCVSCGAPVDGIL